MGNLDFIADVIYGLKMDMGQPITVGNRDTTRNYETGVRATTASEFVIPNAIYLPINMRRQFLQKAGIHRTAYLESGNREILIDKQEIPEGSSFKTEGMYVTINGIKADVVTVEDYQHALIVIVKQVSGMPYD